LTQKWLFIQQQRAKQFKPQTTFPTNIIFEARNGNGWINNNKLIYFLFTSYPSMKFPERISHPHRISLRIHAFFGLFQILPIVFDPPWEIINE
jgi:hypothetical protein